VQAVDCTTISPERFFASDVAKASLANRVPTQLPLCLQLV
jgi:hypothetical protein